MPSSNTTSPVKRPTLSQRSLSEVSVPQRHSPSGLAQSHKPAKPHRAHVVGAHRTHSRNPSSKNLNKIQRLAVEHNLKSDNDPFVLPQVRHHQRKKSAPPSPATSPRAGPHVRWNGSVASLGAHDRTNISMRKNYSTPALRRNVSGGILVKRNHQARKSDTEPKKTVGFELADSEDEWEDNSSYSPESTRRNSIIGGKMNGEETPATGKSPLVHANTTDNDTSNQSLSRQDNMEQHHADQDDKITDRLLQRPHASKAPPAISSVSVTATPPPAERSPQGLPFANPSSSNGAHNRQPSAPSSVTTGASTYHPTQATSSSAEGGVSRFLKNPNPYTGGARSDSDPATPSSFLPHYHPNTPPSPEATTTKRSKSPMHRGRTAEPPSRTQQKLWLQRTAVLTTSPPDHPMAGPPPTSPSTLDPVFTTTNNARSTSHGANGHRAIGSSGIPNGATADSEAKRSRKIYERYASEFSVVRRFREPTTDSFNRLDKLTKSEQGIGRGNSSPALVNGHGDRTPGPSRPATATRHATSDKGLSARFLSKPSKLGSQVRFQNQNGVSSSGDAEGPGEGLDVERQHHNHHDRDQSTVSVVMSNGHVYEEQLDDDPDSCGADAYRPNEEEMLLRRMWDSREVATAGD